MSGDSAIIQTEFVETDYGKNNVKLLHVRKEGSIHYIKELEVNTALTLNNQRDYVYGDNRDIIATDSQKNTVYILAKQYGIGTIEKFSLKVCEHFLNKYAHVVAVNVKIEEYPWKRIEINGEQHAHAFQMVRDCTRFCEVNCPRDGKPVLSAGIRDLRVLKTTQSAFKDFVRDEYRTLPDTEDRVFSTTVSCNWWYNTPTSLGFCLDKSFQQGFCFDKAWEGVQMCILETFAGPADKGEFSPSVQNTLYLTLKKALTQIPQIDKIEMTLPNRHYFDVDFGRFPKLEFTGLKDMVYMGVDKPSGNIHAVVKRSPQSKL